MDVRGKSPLKTEMEKGKITKHDDIKSSGLIVSTGTGSSSHLKSMRKLSLNNLEAVLLKLDIPEGRFSEEEKLELVNDISVEGTYASDSEHLYFKHREIVQNYASSVD